jgi:hypothetical protein
VEGSQRRFLACLTALAMIVAGVQAVSGISELALYLTPCFLIAALLLCGRYVAESRIVRRWRAAVPARRRRSPRGRWRPIPELPLTSLFDRSARVDRGPPAPASA